MNALDFDALQKHEAALVSALIDGLQSIDGVRILGPIPELKQRGHLVSFVVDGIHAHDVAAYLSDHNIAVRAGHHCAQPLTKKWGIGASVRVSFALYNTMQEVEQLIKALKELQK